MTDLSRLDDQPGRARPGGRLDKVGLGFRHR
jgi:hypothetical protein